ncbi:AcrR family transcriptional regulator [Cryobacterium mesophilum]|uniref:TetR/AcrR family transcriptional regulator n=2 Tax=Microbacteriaceae TaxID=85023 RepID=A0A4R8VB29_9MICO|nr:TetR/AcrR family transcriptional regulator [Terrimesophilobacter mesophilus]MBB5633752.1 AcrR family transcriptional regulator [Terrimesophilobacter mesophilus]TFB80434.1 TetR/AcrR family transcriptional regulator [Terrimesophilobacter mesophilus]
MSRRPDPGRKPELLAQILEYLLDKPLASLTFRAVATALGVSTYTLVYQFGTRAELVSDIVGAISDRQSDIEERLITSPGTLDAYYENLEISWRWTLDPRNRQLQRLEFEASMLEALDPDLHNFSRALYGTWLRVGRDSLESFGLSSHDAEIEARIMVDAFYGLQYDLVVNNDAVAATAAFERLVEHHRERVEALAIQPA